jgi:hypothetical protein
MREIGRQYSKDDKTDPTGFLKRARLHQSKFRAETLNLDFDTYGNYLTKKDGEVGKNFYDGFEIFEAVKDRYDKYNKPLYSNMLRSEHIPFNLFIPLNTDKTLLKEIFNEFFGDVIQSIESLKIEYAPSPKEEYLDDRTSFDTYIEYTHTDNTKGIIGIEVKYTEREYPLIKYQTDKRTGKKELTKAWIDVENYKNKSSNSIYLNVTRKCKLYKEEHYLNLIKDDFRQVWRNHILGESILQTAKNQFKHFTSLTLFPKDNEHFVKTSKEYIDMLVDNKNKFIPLTYEDFLFACDKHCTRKEHKDWLNYLTKRYIVTD